jgi:hypothetical protein
MIGRIYATFVIQAISAASYASHKSASRVGEQDMVVYAPNDRQIAAGGAPREQQES